MSGTAVSSVLDEAFERMAASSAFELPNGFVNHGPMGCEALSAMGLDDRIEKWARRFEAVPGPAVNPVPAPTFDWSQALGDHRLLPEWIGHLQLAIDEGGWAQVVEVWVPRLLPALSAKLFHGAIHVGHAVRALTVAETPARHAELARALGYWAARYQVGPPPAESGTGRPGDLRLALGAAAGQAARHYLAAPSIFFLHGVTGAMAVELLIDHIPRAAGETALAQLRAEHARLYQESPQAAEETRVAGVSELELAQTAAESGDVHQVKLVEACRRGFAITGSRLFLAAAEAATGRQAGPAPTPPNPT